MKSIVLIPFVFWVVYAVPADPCNPNTCKVAANCRCSSVESPLPKASDGPQLIAITFDEAVEENIYTSVWQPLLFNRKNPDGQPISATFYVPHEYTDYTRVRDLYVRGFEIGVNSVSKSVYQNYWRNATEAILKQEFGDQRTIISHFANITLDDIIGGRTPQLQIVGDVTINAYSSVGLKYDNSWTTPTFQELFPYTLDYASTQPCSAEKVCPKESHKGFWIAPITNINGNGTIECNSLINCYISGTAEQIEQWLLSEVNKIRNNSRVPMSIILPSAWFSFTANSLEGFTKFLDDLAKLKDVFLVSQKQVLDWMKNPVPLAQYKTTNPPKTAPCSPLTCTLEHEKQARYLRICSDSCPDVYPWLGNPLGKRP